MIKKQFFPDPTIQNVATNDTVYLRGKALFKDHRTGKLEAEPDKNGVIVHVEENGDNEVSWGFYPNGVAKRYHCSCSDFQRFSGGCQHVVAAMFALNQVEASDIPAGGEAPMTVPVASQSNVLNRQAVAELFRYEENEAQMIRRTMKQKPLTIEFTLLIGKPEFFQPFAITMRVGEEYLYVVQDIRRVIEDLLEGNEVFFGKRFTFTEEQYTLKDEDRLLLETIQEVDNVFNSVDAVQQFSTPKEFIVPPQFMQRFLRLIEKCEEGYIAKSFKRSLEQATGKKRKPRLFSNGEKLPVELKMEKVEEDQIKISLFEEEWAELQFYEEAHFVKNDEQFYFLSEKMMEKLKQLKHAFSYTKDQGILLNSEEASDFVSRYLPQVEKSIEVSIPEEVAQTFVRDELKPKLKIDYAKNKLFVKPEFHYGDFAVEPLKDETLNETKNRIFIRNIEKETTLLKHLRLSSRNWQDEKEEWILSQTDAVGDFLYGAIPRLMEEFDVLLTPSANKLFYDESSSPSLEIEWNEKSNMLDVSFEAEDMTQDDLRHLMKQLSEKKKFVRLTNGKLVQLNTDTFQDLKQSVDQLDLNWRELEMKNAVPVYKGLALSEKEDIAKGAKFKKLVSQLFSPETIDFSLPKTLDVTLRPYQETGIKWLQTLDHYGFGGILADDMGLGKTLQTIGYAASCLEKKKDFFLIICPSSVLFNWQKEFETFAPSIQTTLISGNAEERKLAVERAKKEETPIWITSYPLIMRDEELYKETTFHTVILDEAQYVKNNAAKTTQAVKSISSRTKLALSGTPIENNLGELYTLFSIVMPGLFGTKKQFKEMDYTEIAQKIRPFILRRLKKDVLDDLPEKVETNEYIILSDEQKKLYQAQVRMIRSDLESMDNKSEFDANRFRILAGMTRLRQICCDPRLIMPEYRGGSSKLERLKEYVAEALANGRRIVLFSQFTSMLALIKEEFDKQGYSYFYLDGSTKSSDRLELTTRYNEGEKELFLISLKAGGTGLNLTGGDTVILYDSWWNPAIEEQAADRVHRYGQKKTVQVIRMIAEGTIEERINELQDRKRELIDSVIETGEQTLTSLSKDEILSLIGE